MIDKEVQAYNKGYLTAETRDRPDMSEMTEDERFQYKAGYNDSRRSRNLVPYSDAMFTREQAMNEVTAGKKDMVNHPAHYTTGTIEVWDYIRDQELNYHRGNVVKYVSRAGKKDATKELEDLEKALAYLTNEINNLKKSQDSQAL